MPDTRGQRVGYVRVSTAEQNPARQLDALGDLDRIFEDRASGRDRARPGLEDMLQYVRAGDTVHVHSMDRLARSLQDLLELVRTITDRGAVVEFEKERLTFRPGATDPYAEFQMHVLGAVAQLERSLIRERQAEGIAHAKTRGVYKGRRPALTPDQVTEAQERIGAGVPKAVVARELGVSRQTLYNAIARTPTTTPVTVDVDETLSGAG